MTVELHLLATQLMLPDMTLMEETSDSIGFSKGVFCHGGFPWPGDVALPAQVHLLRPQGLGGAVERERGGKKKVALATQKINGL